MENNVNKEELKRESLIEKNILRNNLNELNRNEEVLFYLASYPLFVMTAYLFYKSIFISVILGVMCVSFKGVYKEYIISKKKEALLSQFKDWLYIISSSISIGRSMEVSILDSEKSIYMMYGDSFIYEEVNIMSKSIKSLNMNSEAVLKEFSRRVGIEDVRDFVDTYIICVQSGGNLRKVVLNVIGVLTDRMNIKREVQTIIAQRKLEGRVVASMPIVILFLLNTASPDYLEPMYTTITGRIIMTIAMVSFVASVIWIFKILNWK